MYLGAEQHKKIAFSCPPLPRAPVAALPTLRPWSPGLLRLQRNAGREAPQVGSMQGGTVPGKPPAGDKHSHHQCLTSSGAQTGRGDPLRAPQRIIWLLINQRLSFYLRVLFFFKQTSIIKLLSSDISQIQVLRKIFYTLQLLGD